MLGSSSNISSSSTEGKQPENSCSPAPSGPHSSCLFCYSTFCPQPRIPGPWKREENRSLTYYAPIQIMIYIADIIRMEAAMVIRGVPWPPILFLLRAGCWLTGRPALKGLFVRAGGDRLLVTLGAPSRHGRPCTMIPFS